MHKNSVITIARQFGSGGHEIGRRVAALLGIKVYDKELILLAAEKSPRILAKLRLPKRSLARIGSITVSKGMAMA